MGQEDVADNKPMGFQVQLTDPTLDLTKVSTNATAKLTNLVKLTGVPDEAFLSAGIYVVENTTSNQITYSQTFTSASATPASWPLVR